MNVLHLDEQRGWRGGEQQAHYLIRGLVERGHRCFLAGRPGSEFLARDPGVEVTRIEAPFRGEIDPVTVMKLAHAVRTHAIDVIHAHTSHAHTAACLARLAARRGRVVVSRRVDFPPKRNPINRWKYRFPDCIVAISERIAAELRAFGIDERRLSVVRSAIDPRRFDVPPLPRSELGVPENVPLLGNVAALVGHKDHETLIAAMPKVLERLPDLRLVIAGEGDLRPKLEAQIAELNVGHAVKLLGYRTDVPRILRTLDAFVLSSKMEGLGTTVLDAMACELPVVATDGGGIPEMVTHEETGLLSRAGDPTALAENIVRVFADVEAARAMAQLAHERVLREFGVDAMVEGNLKAYGP